MANIDLGGIIQGKGEPSYAKESGKKAEEETKNTSNIQGILNNAARNIRTKRENAPGDLFESSQSPPIQVKMMHKGGRVHKTGVYRLKKGEVVVAAEDVRKIKERLKQRKTGRKSSRR